MYLAFPPCVNSCLVNMEAWICSSWNFAGMSISSGIWVVVVDTQDQSGHGDAVVLQTKGVVTSWITSWVPR